MKIEDTNRAGTTNKQGVEAKKLIISRSLGIGSFLKRNLRIK
tara:strand:- start:93 stop:218 length:126 start_codon:yes stop_codon:yes gene_type:complete